jgi:hypothetical protein
MASTNGFVLGLIGGLLDFASASLILVGPGGNYGWAALLIVLGAAVVATSVLSVGTLGFKFARIFSYLMVAFGIIMLLIGWAISTGYISSQGVSIIYSAGLVIIGAAMAVNGVMTTRTPMPF